MPFWQYYYKTNLYHNGLQSKTNFNYTSKITASDCLVFVWEQINEFQENN